VALRLAEIHFREPETFQQASHRGARVFIGRFQDAAIQRSLLQLALGFLADFAFKIWIGGGKKAGVARIDFSFFVVEPGNENLGFGKGKSDLSTLHGNIRWLYAREIDPRNYFAVSHQQKSIADQELGHIRTTSAFSGDDFVHGEFDGFEALQLSNLANYGGLIDVDKGMSVQKSANELQKP